MKAAICKEAGKPLVVEDVPIPEPVGRQLLVRVKAASLCHSDLSIISGSFGAQVFPLVVGHEAVSVVEKLGPDASKYGIQVGDVVGAPAWTDMCLDCLDCRTAGPEFCKKLKVMGLTSPGYFAEYTLVDSASAVIISRAGVTLPQPAPSLAPLFCAGITVWDALKRANLGMGITVAIFGLGGLGQLAAQYAQRLGANVLALDVRDEQLIAAKKDGIANEIVNIASLGPEELEQKIMDVNGGELVETAIVTSGVVAAYRSALGVLKVGGRIVVVGLPADPIPIHGWEISNRCIEIVGAKVPGQALSKQCLDFSLRKDIKPKVNTRAFKLEDINEMIDLMKAGKVEDGRMVVEFF